MDGYAVKFEDVKGATPDRPVVLTVIEEIPAGRKPQLTLRSQQAARIFTGAMLPASLLKLSSDLSMSFLFLSLFVLWGPLRTAFTKKA